MSFFSRQARVRRLLHIKSLHISLNTVHSGCNPSNFMSSFTLINWHAALVFENDFKIPLNFVILIYFLQIVKLILHRRRQTIIWAEQGCLRALADLRHSKWFQVGSHSKIRRMVGLPTVLSNQTQWISRFHLKRFSVNMDSSCIVGRLNLLYCNLLITEHISIEQTLNWNNFFFICVFQAKANPLQSCVILIRIFRDFIKRFPPLATTLRLGLFFLSITL